MPFSKNTYIQARLSRDPRFDGQFYTGVMTTGIYCRPICPARPAKEENVRYFKSAEQAEHSGFQPCKRCKPEQACSVNTDNTVRQAIDFISYQPQLSVAELTDKLNIGERQLQRIFKHNLGISPLQFILQKRLRIARDLLMTTTLTITEVAAISGFNSLRTFNQQIKQQYKLPPSQVRHSSKEETFSGVSIKLYYEGELNWPLMLDFFRNRIILGVESVTDKYQRTIAINDGTKTSYGWLEISNPEINIANDNLNKRNYLQLKIQLTDYSNLALIIEKSRMLFDLDCDLSVIKTHLSQDSTLKATLNNYSGLRLPGCWDIFEFSIRAILGQQISVAAATTLAARIAEKYADKELNNKIDLPEPLNLYFPSLQRLSQADFAHLGITNTRQQTLKTWVSFFAKNKTLFSQNQQADQFEKTLCTVKGIGPWTANYIAMRGLGLPDAFPAADLGIIKALSDDEKRLTSKQILTQAEQWRPWRSYAAIYLWHSLK